MLPSWEREDVGRLGIPAYFTQYCRKLAVLGKIISIARVPTNAPEMEA